MPAKQRAALIDTSTFLEEIEKTLDQRPVLAIQGKSHSDVPDGTRITKRERQGRHLIVCADGAGNATLVLNSHTVRRKAWVAAGFYRDGLFAVGAALPLQRWRGAGPAIDEIQRWRPAIVTARGSMRATPMTDRLMRSLADRTCAAYLPGHKPVAASALKELAAKNLYDTLFKILRVITDGNLPASEAGRRKVKPIKGPDALMHAGNALWLAAIDITGERPLPFYKKT